MDLLPDRCAQPRQQWNVLGMEVELPLLSPTSPQDAPGFSHGEECGIPYLGLGYRDTLAWPLNPFAGSRFCGTERLNRALTGLCDAHLAMWLLSARL